MNVKSELEKGNFAVAECTNCKKIVWPASEFCDTCFKTTILRKGDTNGRIIEFSKQDNRYFCLAEFEGGIRLLGEVTSGRPQENQVVKIKRCGLKHGSPFFEMDLGTS